MTAPGSVDSPRPQRRAAFLGIPASALTALPACPACYPAYAGVLSALGLGALSNARAQAVLTAVFLASALGTLAYRARTRRGYGPLLLGLLASATVGIAKFVLGWDAGTYAGVGLLVAASVWNVWPRAAADPGCPACSEVPSGAPSEGSG